MPKTTLKQMNMNVTKLMSVYVANTKFLINRNREVWNILSHQWLPTHRFDMHLKGSIVFAKYYAYTTACKSTLLYESVCCRKLVHTCIPFRVWFGNIFKVTVSLEKSNRIHIQQIVAFGYWSTCTKVQRVNKH